MVGFFAESLKYLRRIGLKTSVVQLIDGSGIDYGRGTILYDSPDTARPYSWQRDADPRTFADMVTPSGLAQIKTYESYGIPDKVPAPAA